MATQKGIKQSSIMWVLLIGGAGYYFWKKKKENEARINALARQQGAVGEEEAAGGGGFGGGGGGGGAAPMIAGDGEDTEINVSVTSDPDGGAAPDPSPPQPSNINCLKFPNTAGCPPPLLQAAVTPVKGTGGNSPMFANPNGNSSPTTPVVAPTSPVGGHSGGGKGGMAATSPVLQASTKKNFVDFDGDFDYMDKSRSRGRNMDFRMKQGYSKTDFDGEL